ncbi:origin recognition complex subunit 5 isoform X1 [Lates japonicus]|uniref:Origin recognition complex subunit 5 isoform X1 n=1 Tax=Lates japonicus TaxID=270547 RepID=A0AAD3NJV4_LATJO|nr:origin recognition complex subunit 5 isoform X1 [Lates japonicus]
MPQPNTGCFPSRLLHFLTTKGELQQILSQDRHPSYSAELYSSYINILLGVLSCRDQRGCTTRLPSTFQSSVSLWQKEK